MANPILAIRLPIKRRTLNINCLILGVKIYVANDSCLARDWRFDGDALEEGGRDQVDVLPWIGEETHHGHGDERAHCPTVVVAWEAGMGWGEVAGDVRVRAEGAEGGTAGVVVLEDCQEGGLEVRQR